MRVQSPRRITRNWIAALPLGALAVLSLLMPGSAVLGQKAAPNVGAVLNKCQNCHGETAQMSHLSMVSRDSIVKGGDHGAGIVPGNAAESLIYKRITGEMLPAMPMAPMPRLSADEIAVVKDWINAGAPAFEAPKAAPAVAAAATDNKTSDGTLLVFGSYSERRITDADRSWWAFKKPVRPATPQVADARWSKNPIDALVAAKRDEKGSRTETF
jgi:hypothetical protein